MTANRLPSNPPTSADYLRAAQARPGALTIRTNADLQAYLRAGCDAAALRGQRVDAMVKLDRALRGVVLGR